MRRLLAVGDVHGCFDMFLDLWQKVQFDPEQDIVVFLGDYTDRGPKSDQMIAWVLAHQQTKHMYFLRGNHEVMLYNAYRPSKALKEACETNDSLRILWLVNGGGQTMSSLSKSGQLLQLLPKWLDAIEQMSTFANVKVGEQLYFFAHAGIDPDKPMNKQTGEDLYWSRKVATNPERYQGDAVLVFGHTPVQALDNRLIEQPVPQFAQKGHVILMDTGSYIPGGRISCADVLTGKVWQSYANPGKEKKSE